MDLDGILRELHEERRWLDTIIAALEAASRSPDGQFVDLLGRGLRGGPASSLAVRLGSAKRREMERLARRVLRKAKTGARKPRSRPSAVLRFPRSRRETRAA
jgi:hypothetical protein